MKFVVDLHLHSKYSRAVSQQMTLPNMAHWAKLKGIDVLATADFTHPFWFDQITAELESTGNGLYKLKQKANDQRLKQEIDASPFASNKQDVSFILSCEVSSIYSQGGKGRRIHTLFMFPSFEAVEKFNKELIKRRANLRSDGRPIVGINSRDLAAIAMECSDRALVIPAHAWTPWFSLYGSFSGFDSVEECFGDMAPFIYGIETGLSSDPDMNWQIADLNNRAILSCSDAHSLEKMGREATVIEAGEISYESIYQAIKSSVIGSRPSTALRMTSSSLSLRAHPSESNDLSRSKGQLSDEGQSVNRSYGIDSDKQKTDQLDTENRKQKTENRIAFTIEFYPEEGKYHFTGHRNCNYSQGPEKDRSAPCPVCGRSLTVGVMDRVEELRTQNSEVKSEEINGVVWRRSVNGRPPYVSIVPLNEIIAEALGVGVGTQKVKDIYLTLVNSLGSEFGILLKATIQDIAKFSNGHVAEGVAKVRMRDIEVVPGYDGNFGIVKIWKEESITEGEGKIQADPQLNLF